MEDQLIFFIDFIGFADVTRKWNDDGGQQLNSIIGLLEELRSLVGEFDFNEQVEDTGTRFLIKPAISTFSDHIVISYPTEHLRKMNEGDFLGSGLLLAGKLISNLAAGAINLGLLIRGGATVGPLYHSHGVVVGPAMVEAYDLESRVSIYPRIAVSRKVYSQVKINPRSIVLLTDGDGITHFNYFTSMVTHGPGGQTPDVWLAKLRETVAQNVEEFERTERWNELAKWVWFGHHLERARSSWPDAMFQTAATA